MVSAFHRPYFEAGVDGLQPILVSLALSLIALSTFSTVGRIIVGQKRGGGWPGQALNALATLLAFVHMIVLIRACDAGLGRHDFGQQTGTFETQSKLRYTLELLSTAAICSAKGSSAALVHQIVGIVYRRIQYSLLAATILFAVFAMLAAAFQCSGSAPRYWMYTPDACNNGGLQYAIVVSNMVTDLWPGVAALPILWQLQTVMSRRLRAMALLGARMIVVIAEIAQLASLARALNRNNDKPWNRAIVVSYTIITMQLSIMCANLPVLSHWVDDLVTGHNGFQVTARDKGFELTEVSRRSRTIKSKDRSRTKSSNEPGSSLPQRHGDGESDHGSQTGILKTTAFQLDHVVTTERVPSVSGKRQHEGVQRQW